jgi:hypothetical protein
MDAAELGHGAARKARKFVSVQGWRASTAKHVWKLQGVCPPAGEPPRLPSVLPRVLWPERYEWRTALTWVLPLHDGFRTFTDVQRRAIAQPYKGIVMIEVGYPGRSPVPVAIDYYDYAFVNEQCLSEVAVYFKMQYQRGGYDDPRVIPGGYVASNSSTYDHYCRLRALARHGLKFDVYGRFGTKFSSELRRSAVQRLQRDSRFGYAGGTSLVSHSQSMREATRARVCVDLPGNGPLCHRLIDYLAIGACVVAPRHAAVLHAELRDREHIVYCREDLADLEDLCAQYVEDEQGRARIAAGAARFFDEHLNRPQLAAYYARALEQHIGPA